MLFSLAIILFCGFAVGGILQKLNLPPLLGMMLTGMLLGPYALNQIDPAILSISADLRQIALIVILIRASLALELKDLELKDLEQMGRPAVLMCFVPATFELAAVLLLAPPLVGVTRLEAAVMGAVLAAVSPAVVVPRMLRLMETGYGRGKSVPQLILAGASVEDIYVIVLFTSFTGMFQGQGFDPLSLLKIPVSILLGLLLGIFIGIAIVWLFQRLHMQDTVKILLLFGVSFLFVSLESALAPFVPVSGLLAVMALGGTILKRHGILAKRLSGKYSKIWVAAELPLFVLVGAAVDIGYIRYAGVMAICLILAALVFRMAGVFLCLLGTRLSGKERLFATIFYLPKATVQTAIGSIPLTLGIPAGNSILTVTVLAILITAPIGAIGMDHTYRHLLQKSP